MRCLYLLLFFACAPLAASDAGWSAYGHDSGGTRYSPLKQVDVRNVSRLQAAWTYHTGALEPATDLNHKAAFEATPILIEGTLYLTTPFNKVIALDPATGAEKWTYDPHIDREADYSEVSSRGVAAWIDSKAPRAAACAVRLFEGTIDARLLALDAKTGKPCTGFGKGGTVDLTANVDYHHCCDYEVTSAPAVVGDLVITGSSIGDNREVSVERGIVRGLRRAHGKTALDVGPHPVVQRAGTPHRRGQRVVHAGGGSGTRPGFHSHGQRQPGLLRRRTAGQQRARQLRGGAEGIHRRGGVVVPGGPSRPLGLRRSLPAGADPVPR